MRCLPSGDLVVMRMLYVLMFIAQENTNEIYQSDNGEEIKNKNKTQ